MRHYSLVAEQSGVPQYAGMGVDDAASATQSGGNMEGKETRFGIVNSALWATATYAGLRRGELQALRWSDLDLAGGLIRVARGWDAKEVELLAAPVAVAMAAAWTWLWGRGRVGRSSVLASGAWVALWGASRAYALYVERFVAVDRWS